MSPILYNVAQLLKEGVGATRERPINGDIYHIDENNPGPVHINGDALLVRTPRGVLVTGHAEADLVLACRRCLEPVETGVDIDFDEEYVATVDVETGVSLTLAEDDDRASLIDDQHILDLTEVLRQYIVIESTSSGLCRPDCKGLCPTCGSNLNLGMCQCDRSMMDPRWAALSRLAQDSDDQG
jgi:uncharacterized protein